MANLIEDDSLSYHIQSLLEKGHNKHEIENTMVANGYDVSFVKQMLFELSRMQTIKKRSQGISFVVFGGLVCLLSFVFYVSNLLPHHFSFYFTLYGLISLGALFLLAGIILLISKWG